MASSPPVNGVWVDGKRHEALDEVADVLEDGYDSLFDELDTAADRASMTSVKVACSWLA